MVVTTMCMFALISCANEPQEFKDKKFNSELFADSSFELGYYSMVKSNIYRNINDSIEIVRGLINNPYSKVIPYLIDLMTDSTITSVGYINPISSFLPIYLMNRVAPFREPHDQIRTYCDSSFICHNAAYCIELILCDKLSYTKVSDSSNISNDNNPFGLYKFQMILNTKTGKAVQNGDLEAVQSLYKKWWLDNKGLPLDSLRALWKKNIRPFSNSIYQWE